MGYFKAGRPTGDTHSASLSGAYTPSSDTHSASLSGACSKGTEAKVSDTGASAFATSPTGHLNTTNNAFYDALGVSQSVTPPANCSQMLCIVVVTASNNGGTTTIQVVRDGNVVGTSSAFTNAKNLYFVVVDTGYTIGVASTYKVQLKVNASNATHYTCLICIPITDTHSASLAGAYTASSDTHSASLSGSAGVCN